MKFIALLVSAAICFTSVESGATIGLTQGVPCVIREELKGVGSIMNAASTAQSMVVASKNGNMDALTGLPTCANMFVGTVPTMGPVDAAGMVASGLAVAPLSTSNPASSVVSTSQASGTLGNFYVGSTLRATTPPGRAVPAHPRQTRMTVANTFDSASATHFFFAAQLTTYGTGTGSNGNPILSAATYSTAASNPFAAVTVPATLLAPTDMVLAVRAKATPSSPVAVPRVTIMKKTAAGTVMAVQALASLTGTTVTLSAPVASATWPATVTTVDDADVASDNKAVFTTSNGVVHGAVPTVTGSTALPLPTSRRVATMAVMQDVVDSTGASTGYMLSSMEHHLSQQQFGRMHMTTYAISPAMTGATLNVLASKTVSARSESAGAVQLAAVQTAAMPSAALASGSSAAGFITMISTPDPRTCLLENRRNQALYCKCMRKCCESAERGHLHCPRRCELEEPCDDCFRDFDRDFLRPDDFDPMMPEIAEGMEDLAEFRDIDGFRPCGCMEINDECRRCGRDGDLRECKCCCRKYLRRSLCGRTIMESVGYSVTIM